MDSTEALKVLEESKLIVVDSAKNLKKGLERVEVIEKEVKELAKDPKKNAKLMSYLNCALNFFTKKIGIYQKETDAAKAKKELLETKRSDAQKKLEERKLEHSAYQSKKK